METPLFQAANGLKHFVHDHPLVCWKLANLESAWFRPVRGVSWDRHLAVWSRLGDVEPRILPLARRLCGQHQIEEGSLRFQLKRQAARGEHWAALFFMTDPPVE